MNDRLPLLFAGCGLGRNAASSGDSVSRTAIPGLAVTP